MSWVLSALPIAATVLSSTAPASSSRQVENVAAFARLYGVVRFFYPSDAAAELDWNRFAVIGVARTRPARDARELGVALQQLVAPLGPGFEIAATLQPAAAGDATAGEPLVAWRYIGPGFSSIGGAYRAKRTHRAPPEPASEGFATLMQTTAAASLIGKDIRLTAQARAITPAAGGGGALWLRVDRANQVMGFFDNMADRPIRESEWRSYAIEGTVADDAENVAFGVMALGTVTADFDAVELAVKDATGRWLPLAIQDPGFEAAETEQRGWSKAGSRPVPISRPSTGAPAGGQYVRFAPPAGGPADTELFPEGAPAPGAHVDVDLGSGLRARVPLALTDAAARPDSGRRGDLDALRTALTAAAGPASDLDERLADIVVAWSVLRHFYPYWAEAGVDWDARLTPQLETARLAETRGARRDAVRSLVADARDGHGSVADTLDKTQRGELPVRLSVIEGRLVVVTSARPMEAPVGALVSTIDGVPAKDRLARALSLASGTTQWREAAGLGPLTSGPTGTTVRVGLDTGPGAREVELTYGAPPPPVKRPGPVVELEPGLWYADLTRSKMAEIAPKLAAIAAARAVVFDVRGYPTDAGAGVLPHLLDAPETDRWMHVAKIVGPFYATAGWDAFGWDMRPASPRIAGKVVFLTDGGAISYAESVMGYVADRKLGTIVGSATAGTNGNIASFVTPGGFRVFFTGMRVTGHDGRSVHHLVGVKPDVPVTPTVAGVRAGQDEVLERGLAVARVGATIR